MDRFRVPSWWPVAVLFALAGCHPDAAGDAPMFERKISIADRFYDVDALDAQRAVVVGYGGKILRTEDGGRSWEVVKAGTDRALYSVEFPDSQHGWISGQGGLILHSDDAGKTWTPQKSGTPLYLFSIDFVNEREGWAVGDKATYVRTRDGGNTWSLGKIGSAASLTADEAVLSEDPVLYGVQFADDKTGWIVGEFGNIYHTADAGRTWRTQQETLIGEGFFDALDIPTFFGVHFTDARNGIAAALEGRIARTRDGGASWKYEEFDLKEPMVDPLFQPFQLLDGPAWAVGAAGEVARRQPPGAWQRASLGMEILTWLRGVDFVDAQHGWIVGGYGMILHTTDGGKSWIPSLG